MQVPHTDVSERSILKAQSYCLALVAAMLSVILSIHSVSAQGSEAIAERPAIDVRIESAPDVSLAATLRLPASAGRHPVLIIQSGSGPSTRGGFISLENLLNDAGIATIEFDKRGVGQSTGIFTDTMQDMEADLAATIKWLRAHPEIDGSRIALLGYSQGAAAVPIVAERDGKIAAIVFLAGPVGERATMFLDGMRNQLVESGRDPELVDGVTAATRRWMEARSREAPIKEQANARAAVVTAFKKAGFPADDAEGATSVLDSPQLLSMYLTAPGTALEEINIPILAIFGARDEIVGAQAEPAATALGENPKALVIQVPGASHGFGYRHVDAPPRENPDGGPWLSLLPKEQIVSWLCDWLVEEPWANGSEDPEG